MHPFHFVAAFALAGFACLSLGKTHPRHLKWTDARAIVGITLVLIGIAGCTALARVGGGK